MYVLLLFIINRKYHDDGEPGVHDIVASISLGSTAGAPSTSLHSLTFSDEIPT